MWTCAAHKLNPSPESVKSTAPKITPNPIANLPINMSFQRKRESIFVIPALFCHSCEGRNPLPLRASEWTPASAGVTYPWFPALSGILS
jgi:hypothetical protein